MWAEEFGIGEMQLSPEAFASLDPREFWIKHAAFARAEDRRRSLFFELASMTVPGQKPSEQSAMQQSINALRRYPVKQWTVIPDGEDDIRA